MYRVGVKFNLFPILDFRQLDAVKTLYFPDYYCQAQYDETIRQVIKGQLPVKACQPVPRLQNQST